MSTALTNIPIGIKLPISSGQVSGYFDQTTDSLTAYRMNIINLLRTIPGERRMNPAFGCRLWNLVFEQNDTFLSDRISKIIKEDISRWISGVTVDLVQVKYFQNDESESLVDTYKLYINVNFTVNVINQEDVVDIVLTKNRI